LHNLPQELLETCNVLLIIGDEALISDDFDEGGERSNAVEDLSIVFKGRRSNLIAIFIRLMHD
jgi:hypothetical protein